MAHTSISLAEHGKYYEGDALEIPFEILDKADHPVDLSDTDIEFLVKDARTDADADAVLTKSSTNTGEAEITDSSAGQAVVYIDTGDTDGVLTDDTGDQLEQDEFVWSFRVTDANGNRVTSAEGTWTIHAV